MKPAAAKAASSPDALSRRSIGLAALVLGVAMFLVFGDVMIAGGSKVLSKPGCDIYLAGLGRWSFNFGQLAHGHFPLWCPALFCGYPSFGGMQTGLVYPLNLPLLFLSTAAGINWSFILHTFLGGMFMYLWLGRQSLHRYACLAGALMFAFSAPFYLRAYAGHLTPNNTIAWIPLVFLAIEGIIATPTLGWFLLGAGAVSMQFLAGYPQILFYTAIAAALYTLARLHESPKLWKSLALLALMNAFVLVLTCVQWSAGLAMADECVRKGGVPYEFAGSLSLPPANWLTLIRPGIFGDMETVPYWGRWYLWEMCLFFSVVGLFFSAIGLFHVKRRVVFSAAGIGLATGILAMGVYSPHFRFFYDHVPGFNMFRSNSKFSVLVVTFLIFLSAHGLDILFRDNRKKLSAGMFFGALAAFLAVAVMFGFVELCTANQFKAIMDNSLNSGETFLFNPYSLSSPEGVANSAKFTADELAEALCFLAGLAVALGLIWRRPQWRSRLAPIVVGLIGVELLLFARSEHVSFPPDLIRAPLLNATIRQQLADGRVASQSIPDLEVFLKQNLGDGRTFSPEGLNVAMYMDGVSDLWGYGSDGVIRRYAEFIAYTQGGNPDDVTGYQRFTTVHRRFDMLRCKCVLAMQANHTLAVVSTAGLAPLPRFSLITDWQVDAQRDSVLRDISATTFNPRQTVVLERRPLGWTLPEKSGPEKSGLEKSVPDKSASSEAPGAVRILNESTDWQEIEVTVSKPAILLETDLYTPNWHVYSLPGSSQSAYELIPANYILRGVPLQAGKHHLRIEYRPTGFVVGKWISLVSLAAFISLAVLWSVLRRKLAQLPTPLRKGEGFA